MKYHHLTVDQRYLIEILRSMGCSQCMIAEKLGPIKISNATLVQA